MLWEGVSHLHASYPGLHQVCEPANRVRSQTRSLEPDKTLGASDALEAMFTELLQAALELLQTPLVLLQTPLMQLQAPLELLHAPLELLQALLELLQVPLELH